MNTPVIHITDFNYCIIPLVDYQYVGCLKSPFLQHCIAVKTYVIDHSIRVSRAKDCLRRYLQRDQDVDDRNFTNYCPKLTVVFNVD